MERRMFKKLYNNLISVRLFIFGWLYFCPLISLFGQLDDIVLLSTLPAVVKGGNALHNEYVVGLCDAEATFTISVTKDNRTRKTSRSLR
jgi:ABC-type tungstate transport system substrate-binding protein